MSSTRTTRYNLRSRKAQATPHPPIPGQFLTPQQPPKAESDEESSSSESSLSTCVSERAATTSPGRLFSEVAADPSRGSVAREEVSGRTQSPPAVSGRGISSATPSAVVGTPLNEKSYASYVEEVEDEDAVRQQQGPVPDDGHWTSVNYGKKKKSNVIVEREDEDEVPSPPKAKGKARELPKESREQASSAGNSSSPPAQQPEPPRRYPEDADFPPLPRRERSSSRGEGPSDEAKRQGKTVDPRNWGAAGIDEAELDPEYQRKILDSLSNVQRGTAEPSEDGSSDLDIEEQRQLLEFYKSLKKDRRAQRAPPAAATATLEPEGDVPPPLEPIPDEAPGDDESLIGSDEDESDVDQVAADDAGQPMPAPVDPRLAKLEESVAAMAAALREVTPRLAERPGKKASKKSKSKAAKAKSKGSKEPRIGSTAERLGQYGLEANSGGGRAYLGREAGPSALEPASQVEPGSYLGQTFENLRARSKSAAERKRRRRAPSSSSSSSGSSEPASDDGGSDGGGSSSGGGGSSDDSSGDESSDSSSSSASSSSSDDSAKKRKRRKSKKKAKERKRTEKRKLKKPAYKPREPEKYGGKADVQLFHKFVQEVESYLNGYDIDESQYATAISHFLTGDAYSFYTLEVSANPSAWDLHRFFRGLFNHCFPVNFRLSQLEKLQTFSQGNKSVKSFVHELKNLFLMAGIMSERDKVLKLWNGLNAYLQRELWRFQLSPTESSFEEVVSAAIRFEISALAAKGSRGGGEGGGRDNRGDGGGGGSNHNSHGGRDNRNGRRRDGRGSERRKDSNADKGNANGSAARRDNRGVGSSAGTSRQPDGRPKLSEKERAELQAAGKCFVCKEPGHLSRNCPRANNARSNRKGRPPGVSVNAMHVDIAGTEQLRALVDSTPVIGDSSLEVNMAHMLVSDTCMSDRGESEDEVVRLLAGMSLCEADSSSDDSSRILADEDVSVEAPDIELPPISQDGRAYKRVGDLLADHASRVLQRHVPFCCQDVALQQHAEGIETDVHAQLAVYNTGNGQYVIMGRDPVPDIFVPETWLLDPEFNLPHWYKYKVATHLGHRRCRRKIPGEPMGDALAEGLRRTLEREIPYPSSWRRFMGPSLVGDRFVCYSNESDPDVITVHDAYLFTESAVDRSALLNPHFDAANSYAKAIRRAAVASDDEESVRAESVNDMLDLTAVFGVLYDELEEFDGSWLECNGVRLDVAPTALPALERTAGKVRDLKRKVPDPIVVVVNINGQPARALLDSGSSADFISSKLVRQVGVKPFELKKQLPLLLAVQGSRGKISMGCIADIQYQSIKYPRYFDIANLLNYDLILGTPWFFQHQLKIGFNPTTVVFGSQKPLPIVGTGTRELESHAADLLENRLETARQYLREYARPIASTDASDTPLPPLRAINHEIPLKDPSKVTPWRPSKCPDALRELWAKKRDAYLKTGRWRMSNARVTSPMLLLTKPGTGIRGVPPRLRCVFDLRERNKNTVKVTSPLPDMDGILRRVSKKPFRSSMDGKDAYECIRIAPEHVERAAMTTPDGNMVSLVLQQGDCNAVATYQTLMNHLFGPYIGVFMDVYLDDLLIYSDTLEDHIKHVKIIIDILKREKLYLNADKLKFLCPELKVLGRVIDDEGIRMDPDKVDSVLNWKVPTSKELLRGFLGSVGYLADDVGLIRIPMGVLTELTSADRCFKWDATHQRAFDEIKRLVAAHRAHHRVPLDYSEGAPPIWLVTDGSVSGVAGVISQGQDHRTAKVAAFFSAKLTSAQANYPVHEIEMLAGVESMRRHRDILLGCQFTWVTDHKGLTHLLGQKNLSARQARWIERISEFNFSVEYIPGLENILPDALSRLYSNDAPGTVRAPSEFTQYDEDEDLPARLASFNISMPVLVDAEGAAAQAGASQPQVRRSTRRRAQVPPAETGRPETSLEFAKRIHKLVLHGPKPRERAEGGSQGDITAQPEPKKSNVGTKSRDDSNNAAADIESSGGMAGTTGSSSSTTSRADPDILSEGAGDAAESPLLELLAAQDGGFHIPDLVRRKYEQDAFFAGILRDPKQFKNFHVSGGLMILKEGGKERLCIPDVRVAGRSLREIIISHAHSLLAHLGATKTYNLLRDNVWWKTLGTDVQKYCESCTTCKRSKPSNQKPYGLLNPLPVPSLPWEAIGIDFVGPLPESSDRDGTYDSITVVICLLTAMVHLIPSKTTYTAKEIAELVFAEVYKLHGLPRAIVSDRDVLFTSTFWTRLHQLLGVELRMSSAYHPESDGSTERANRTVTQMLRQCISPKQKDWVSKLPGIEFAINLARSNSTGYAPFFLNSGRMPRSMIWEHASNEEYPGVRAYAQKVKYAIMSAHDSILAARVKQTRDANRKRRPAPFAKDDLVYVSTKNMSLPKGLARKLTPKYIGPYRIIEDYKNNSYKLELPANLRQRGIHDVFHASLLRVHIPNDDRLFPGRLASQISELDDQENEWAIEKLTGHRGSGKLAIFEALWKSGDRTWVPYATIRHLGAMGEYLSAAGVESVDDLPEGMSQPPDDPQVFAGAVQLDISRSARRTGIRSESSRPLPPSRIPRLVRPSRPSPSHTPSPRSFVSASLSRAARRSLNAITTTRHREPRPAFEPIRPHERRRSLTPPRRISLPTPHEARRRRSSPRSTPLRSLLSQLDYPSTTIVALLAILFIMVAGVVCQWHKDIRFLPRGAFTIVDPEHEEVVYYSNEQGRRCLFMDLAVRRGNPDLKLGVPAGYHALRRCLESGDPDCPFRLSKIDPATGETAVVGKPVPIDQLCPALAPAAVVVSAKERERKEIAEDAVWNYAKHQQNMARRRLEEQEERKRKAMEKQQAIMRGTYFGEYDERPAKKQKEMTSSKKAFVPQAEAPATEKGSRGPATSEPGEVEEFIDYEEDPFTLSTSTTTSAASSSSTVEAAVTAPAEKAAKKKGKTKKTSASTEESSTVPMDQDKA